MYWDRDFSHELRSGFHRVVYLHRKYPISLLIEKDNISIF